MVGNSWSNGSLQLVVIVLDHALLHTETRLDTCIICIKMCYKLLQFSAASFVSEHLVSEEGC